MLLQLLPGGKGGGALHTGICPAEVPGGGAGTGGGSWCTQIQIVGGVAAHAAVATW